MELELGAAFGRDFHWSNTWRAQITWRGVTAWKCPLDLWSYQQILHDTQPELVIECGVAMGGTTLFLADMLRLTGGGRVLGIDVDLSGVADIACAHPGVTLIEGSSLSDDVLAAVARHASGRRVMVILDSDHRVTHVLAELRAYADFVTPGCYLVCEDGNLDLPAMPVVPGYAGPYAALTQFLVERADFAFDETRVLGSTFNPLGYLLRASGRPDEVRD